MATSEDYARVDPLESQKSEEKFVNTAAFFVFGLVIYCIGMVFFSAAEDLLQGTSLPSTLTLIAALAPYALCAVVLPNFVQRVPQVVVPSAVSLFFSAGLLLMALTTHTETKVLGIITISLGTGVGDTLYLGHTARYQDTAVRAFTAGSGVGLIFSVFYYTGMTTWLCVSPPTTLLVLLVMPPLLPMFYCLMDKNQSTKYVSKATAYKDIPYTSALYSAKRPEHFYLTWKEKLQAIGENRLLFSSFFIGYVCEYVTLQAIVTTLAFPNAPFDPRDHYQYYAGIFVTGEFIGRIYGLVLKLLRCNIPDVTRHTWIFSLIIFVNMLFLLLASWYRFLNSVYIVLAVVFFIGLNAGALYCNTFAMASRGSSSRHVEFSRSFLTIALGTGILSAGLLGLKVEPLLNEHCEITSKGSFYCLTRSMQAWNSSSC